MLRGILTAIVLAAAAIPLASIAAAVAGVRRGRRVIQWVYRSFCRLALAMTAVELLPAVWHADRSRLPAQLVVVSNHESYLDVPTVVVSLGHRCVRFVAKAQLFRIPFFGWGLSATGNIRVHRNRTTADLKRLQQPAARARDNDILFFAEGTRSAEGSYRPFKKGAFMFAIHEQRSILPVAVGGSFECLRPHSLRVRPGKIAFVVGEPIPVTGLTEADRDTLRDRVHAAVAALRQEALRLAGSPRAGEGMAPDHPKQEAQHGAAARLG